MAAAFSAFAQQRDEIKQSDKFARQIGQFESDWLTASLNVDNAWIERFFTGRLFVAAVENEAVKNRTRGVLEIIDPQLKPEEMKVRIAGNITVLTNRATETGSSNRSFYFLDTFNKRGGKWRIIASNFSPAAVSINETDEQIIMRNEREWGDAAVKKDSAELRRSIADDFTGVESSGEIFDKARFINNIESGAGGNIQSGAPEDLKVRIYGDTALATGRLSIKDEKMPAADNLKLFFTDVWTKQDGRWQIVNRQATPIR